MRIRDRESVAWQQLDEIYGPLILLWCHTAKVPANDSEDIRQVVWGAVLQGLDGFSREKPSDTFRGWLRGITRYKICDYWRDKSKEPNTAEFDLGIVEDLFSDAELLDDEKQVLVNTVIDYIARKYKEHNWRAFVLVKGHEMDRHLVAEQLGITKDSVDSAVSRIGKKLEQEFGDFKC